MYSTDKPGSRALNDRLTDRLTEETRRRMASVLIAQTPELCRQWSEALVSMPGSIYAQAPRSEVLYSAERLFAAYVEYLRTGNREPLRTTINTAARRRFRTGCPLVSLLETVGAARVTILPALSAAFAQEPETLAEAISALMTGEETAAVWIAEAYEEVADELLKTAEQERLRAERDKVIFGREMARLATNDRLILCDPTDIQPHLGGQVVPVITARDVRRARDVARELAETLNWSPARAYELQLCVGEAGTNALRHAGTATFQAWSEDNTIVFRIADMGPGIDFNRIPSALSSGYSTGSSLGMGFTLMLELADVIRLGTDKRGTVLELTLGDR